VTHGRSSRNAIKHAIKAAAEEVEHDVVGKISELIAPQLAAT
jgi:fatty acid/phospholipid biosynthesis enzyme